MEFKCRECHAEFDEPYIYYEHHGFYQPPYEEWQVCPYCGSTDWDSITIVGEEENDPDD